MVRKDVAAAKAHATEAAAFFQAGPWSPRQQRLVSLNLALLRGYTGDADLRDIMNLLEQLVHYDKMIMASAWGETARVLAVTGHPEEALTCLRRLLAGPSIESPNELRDDPHLAPLKSDPRFEKILQSAKPL